MKIKIKKEVEIKPFSTPNFVLLEGSDNANAPPIPLSELDYDALNELCRAFRKEVFIKAKQSDRIGLS